jgi:uncharacterized protein YyaL (SSP411 family)/thiol-disulfide isomerase/thioredoxin
MPNRLADETSPYLLQHADNPVDWYPWGPEALAAARDQNKPILLSIGYSACHWCHVMEEESFSNDEMAGHMNTAFINIKVDREERPDLDDVYMQAVQAFSGGQGGWPMTVFLFPDGRPFFGGTYFPPEPKQGLPSFSQVMAYAVHLFTDKRDRAESSADKLVEMLAQSGQFPDSTNADVSWLDAVAGASDDAYDVDNGGFGSSPKFPPHGTLPVLLAHYQRTGRDRSLDMVKGSLDGMMRGGTYDLLGGGFCRYSTDAEWTVPHFEKMLYDNALLVPTYVDAWRITGDDRYARVARETLDYLVRDMRLSEGGFAASEDADSEGGEGAFYAWTPEELAGLLGIDDGIQACLMLGITQSGTFERGTSVLRTAVFPEDLTDDKRSLYDAALTALREARDERTRPSRDDKAVAAWNGFALSAFAHAGSHLHDDAYTRVARETARFLLDVQTVDGRLMRTFKDGVAKTPAFLEDYAAVAIGLYDLYQNTFESEWLTAAVAMTDTMVELFWDADNGGLFFAGNDVDPLVVRGKRLVGGAEPSGNGQAAWLFARLGTLCGRDDLTAKATVITTGMSELVTRAARAMGPAALAAAWLQGPVQELGFVGDRVAASPLIGVARGQFNPFRVLAHNAAGHAHALVPWMADRDEKEGSATAYLCQNYTCQAPVVDVSALLTQLTRAGQPVQRARVGAARVYAPSLPTDPSFWLNTDTPLSLEALKGQVVVLDFWTYCCINCHHVLPVLAEVEDHFADESVVVLGIHSAKFPAERERKNVERAIARHTIRHPVILDPEHKLWSEFAVKSWPSVLVLDTLGRVAWHRAGEVRADELTEVVARLVAEGKAHETVASPLAYRAAEPSLTSTLSFPGKLSVWPNYAKQAQGANPFGPDARLYISDTGNHRILEALWRLGPEGWPEAEVTRIWGTGVAGFADGETAQFNGPQGLTRRDDTLYVADTDNHRVRAIDLETGLVRTLIGSGELGRGGTINPADPTALNLRSPWDISAANDVMFIAMAGAHQIWLHMDEPVRSGPFIGTGSEAHVDGDPAQAALAQPSGLQVHGQYLFWVDSETSSLRILDMSKRHVDTVLGKELFDFGDVDGAAEDVLLQHPLGLTVADATVYIADTYNHKIKAVDMGKNAVTTTFAGGEGILCEPSDIDVSGPFLVVADSGNHRLRVIDRGEGEVRTVVIKGL